MVIVGLSLEKKEYLTRFQIIYNTIKNEEHMVATNTITNKFENHLLSIKAEHQKQIRPNLHHPTYNERQQKIIELIDWTMDKYKTAVNIQKMNE